MTIAVNDAGDVLTLNGGAWKPATVAVNDAGDRLALDGKSWVPLAASKPPDTYNEFGAVPMNAEAAAKEPQTLPAAAINALVRSPVTTTGAAIAGAGEATRAAGAQGTQRQIGVMDAIDRGDVVPDQQDVIGYQYLSPEQRAKARADFTAAGADLAKRPDNLLTRAGTALESGAKATLPVSPENEGITTGVAGMVGGIAPILAAGAVGGPIGAAAVIGGQAYHGTYQEAIGKGATPEQAEDAAGKSAAAQVLTMALPVNRLMTVPVSLREPLAKTLVNLGINGIEFGSANAVGTFANNYVAQQTYDPGRSLTQGTGEAGLEGAIAGLIIPAVGGFARAGMNAVSERNANYTAAAMQRDMKQITDAKDLDTAIAKANEVAGTNPTFDNLRQETPETASPAAPSEPAVYDWASLFGGGKDTAGGARGSPEFYQPGPAGTEGTRIAPDITPGRRLPGIYGGEPDVTAGPFEPQSAGAAASRERTPASQIDPAPAEAAAIRQQGEVERLALPPTQNDTAIYIPGTKPTLAEVTGNPRDAMDQAYNRQQPEAMTQHIAQENHNSEVVANYYADTAGSRPALLRMETARDDQAAADIKGVFGDPHDVRAPADPTPTIDLMQGILENPRQGERDAVIKTLTKLADKFYNEDGELKTDPYALYGIGEHINDLLRGVGDTETNSAARVLKRELTQIKESLYSDIEAAAPGFARYRQNYQEASRAIDAMQLLQDARLSLLNKDQHITPAKWFSFMRDIVEGRSDPMDPASSLSEEQMDRLWNITDQLKRSTFVDAGKPRGSWTSMMQEWGGRFARLAAHGVAGYTFPVVGNLGVEMGVNALRRRNVTNEMNRVLNPDLGQTTP
jgi:hypothetical protein